MKFLRLVVLLVAVISSVSSYAQDVEPRRRTLKDTALEKEQEHLRDKRSADQSYYFAFGPAFYGNLNSKESGLVASGGYYWNIEDSIDVGLILDFGFSGKESDIKFLNPHIEGRYIFTAYDVAPFVGAGIGYGVSTAHDDGGVLSFEDSANGFSGTLMAGVKFFRTSSFHLIVDLAYTQILDENSFGNPSMTAIRIGVNF